MDPDDLAGGCLGVLIGLFVIAVALLACDVIYVSGYGDAEKSWQTEAIKHNAAEWRINPTTGDKTFTWK